MCSNLKRNKLAKSSTNYIFFGVYESNLRTFQIVNVFWCYSILDCSMLTVIGAGTIIVRGLPPGIQCKRLYLFRSHKTSILERSLIILILSSWTFSQIVLGLYNIFFILKQNSKKYLLTHWTETKAMTWKVLLGTLDKERRLLFWRILKKK